MNNQPKQEIAHPYTNRLSKESSPYLLQHAHNPVDWYAWGPQALEKAKAEDKPILLSIGYSACHWCHRLREESFENEDTARLINEHFISIKVDREERPDLDALYMAAVQALTGSGGWPMTVFLLPDGTPFYGGTYFPPVPRYGMPSFPELLRNMASLYETRRDEVEKQAQAFRDFYQQQQAVRLELPTDMLAPGTGITPEVLVQAANEHVARFDTQHGGIGRAPKFPHPMNLDFLLRIASRSRTEAALFNPQVLPLVYQSLDAMAGGGIYDQVGGGFHRYATDAEWLVPHFEKMLYDNAQLALVYLHAWQFGGDARYRQVCEQTLDYVLREMTDPSGGFYSTQDADSEGVEGKFYVWTPQELRDALGADDAAIVSRLWGVSDGGNFEGKNILHIQEDAAAVAQALAISVERVQQAVTRARRDLYGVRAHRIWPGKDDKVLTAWNGLMLRAFAEAARILQRDDYRAAAMCNADFLITALGGDGPLRRSWRNGQAKIPAYLEDYGALVNALLSVYETTGEARYFQQAQRRADEMLLRFWDDTAGSFFDTANDHEQLVGRPRELTDNATPSGTSLATEALLRLAAFTGDARYHEHATRIVLPLSAMMAEQPLGFGYLLCALDDFVGPLYEVAVVGQRGDAAFNALLDALATRFLPRMVLAIAAPNDTTAQASVPLLTGRSMLDGAPAAYVCRGFVCQRPVTTPSALMEWLA